MSMSMGGMRRYAACALGYCGIRKLYDARLARGCSGTGRPDEPGEPVLLGSKAVCFVVGTAMNAALWPVVVDRLDAWRRYLRATQAPFRETSH